MQRAAVYDVIHIVTAVALVCLLAAYYGWLNPDALCYLALADNVSAGRGLTVRPSWGETYFAVFPAAYPLAIVAIKTVLGSSAFVASKIVNGLAVLGSVALAARLTRAPLLVVAAVMLSIPLINLVSYTYSEPLFIFACILALYALERFCACGQQRFLLLYLAALVLSVGARYMGVHLLAGHALVVWLATAKKEPRIRWSALAAVAVAVAAACAYLAVNKALTGHITGIFRPPAPEGLPKLIWTFGAEVGTSTILILFALLAGMSRVATHAFNRHAFVRAWLASPLSILGMACLGLLFIVRVVYFFDPFNSRLVTPGAVLLALGALQALMQTSAVQPLVVDRRLHGTFALLVFVSLLFNYRENMPHRHEDRADHMHQYAQRFGGLEEGTVILSPEPNPQGGWHFNSPVITADRVYFAPPYSGKYFYPEKLDAYRARLAALRYKGAPPAKYVFDFSLFADIEALKVYFTDFEVDPEVAAWMERYFAPHARVECCECANY